MCLFFPIWQIARERFNHDWLKNQYIPALESFRNILKGDVQRINAHQDFFEIDLPQWEIHQAEAACLIRRFEESMSPHVLFNEIPLCGCDEGTRTWMGGLVMTLWSVRLSISDLTQHAALCLESVDAAYEKLKAGIEENIDAGMNERLFQRFEEFRHSCHALADAFERFQNNVRVV